MRVTIDKGVIRSPAHLFYDDITKEYGWSDEISEESYVITDKFGIIYDINEIRKLLGFSEIYPRFDTFEKAYRGLTDCPIPWFHIVPKKAFLSHMKEIFSKALTQISLENDNRYIGTFLSEREMLCTLNRAKLDLNKVQNYIKDEENPALKKNLESFTGTDQWAPEVFYSQTSTATGRLVVKKGPQILTLPKKYRDIFTSRYEEGHIMEIDFTSLEPAVLANLQEITIQGDIYETLSKKIFDGEISRGITKVLMLSALYGASTTTLQNLIPKKYSAKELITKIHTFFDTRRLIGSLKKEIKESGFMYNFFGRRIKKTDEYRLVSHYLQSTAVDVALLGFKEIFIKIKEWDVSPLYIVHDAMVIDVSSRYLDKLQKIADDGIKIPQLGKFSLKMKPFYSSQ